MDEETKFATNAPNRFWLETLKYIPLKVIPALSGLLTLYFLTRSFSTHNYITYAAIAASILLVMQLFGGWVNSSMMYFIPTAKNGSDEEFILSHFLMLQLFFAVAGAAVILFVVFSSSGSVLLGFLSVLILCFQLFINVSFSFLQAKRLIRAQVISSSFQSGLQILAVLISYFLLKDNLASFFILYACSFIPSVIILVMNRHINIGGVLKKNLKLTKDLTLKLLAYGIPMCIWFFSNQFYSIGDRLLLKYLEITEDVVNYVAFKDLTIGLSGFVSMPLLFASHPIIMKLVLKEDNRTAAANIIEQNIDVLLSFFLPFCVLTLFFGSKLVQIFGSKFVLDSFLMHLIVLTVLCNILSIYLQKGLEVSFRILQMMKLSLVVAGVSLLCNFFLLPRFGVEAAIIVALLCHIIYAVMVTYSSRKTITLQARRIGVVFHLILLAGSYIIFILQDNSTKWMFIQIAYLVIIFFIILYRFCFLKNNFFEKFYGIIRKKRL